MHMQVEEANARVIKEREAVKKAVEEAPPVIKEVPVLVQDTAKVESLTAEVENLKVNYLYFRFSLVLLSLYLMVNHYNHLS